MSNLLPRDEPSPRRVVDPAQDPDGHSAYRREGLDFCGGGAETGGDVGLLEPVKNDSQLILDQ